MCRIEQTDTPAETGGVSDTGTHACGMDITPGFTLTDLHTCWEGRKLGYRDTQELDLGHSLGKGRGQTGSSWALVYAQRAQRLGPRIRQLGQYRALSDDELPQRHRESGRERLQLTQVIEVQHSSAGG